MTTDKNKFKKEMEASQYFMNKNAKSMFDVIDMCEYYKTEEKAVRQTNRSEAGSFVNLLNQEIEELKNSMKDKENQIEEIVKKKLEEIKFIWAHRAEERADSMGKKDMTITIEQAHEDLDIVLELFKDNVVLSREEYNKYLFIKSVFDKGVATELINMQERIDNFEKELKQASKETAEKFIKECKKYKVRKSSLIGIDQRDIGVSWIEMPEWKLEEFAKQFEVETQE